MKTRHDFVSNSSSCSFFIHVQSQQDKDELLKRQEAISKFFRGSFIDIEGYCNFCNPDLETVEVGEYARFSSGEDHYLRAYDNFWNMVALFDGYDFKCIADRDAHITHGEQPE